MTAKHFLAALLGAVAFFLWSFVAHTLTPLGHAGLTMLPETEAVSAAMQSAIGDKHGMYMFPTAGLGPNSTRAEHTAAMEQIMEEMKTKPSGLLIYHPAGRTFNFGKTLGIQFAIYFFEALIVVYLLAQAAVAAFGSRVLFVTAVGLLPAIATNLGHWNWYGYTTAYTFANVAMELIGFLCAGIAIAFVLKNTPARSSV